MTELSNLKELYRLLKPLGSTSLKSTKIEEVGLFLHTLTFSTDGRTAFNWPISGAGAFQFAYSEVDGSWTCTGTLFGVTPEANNPKTWFTEIINSLKFKEQLLIGMLAKATTLWERYNGDLAQFTYRLGVEFSSSTTMVHKADGVYVWFKPTHPDTLLAFSEAREKPKYGMVRTAYFGFYEPAATHTWKMTPQNLHHIRSEISDFVVQAKTFVSKATACLDFDPQ